MLAIGLLGLLVACGGGSKPTITTTPTTADPALATTTTTAAALPTSTTGLSSGSPMLKIAPVKGPVGAVFTFAASGFPAAAKVSFHITMPDKKTFVGPPHTVGSDGRVATSYKVTPPSPAGTYTVEAVGPNGTAASASFTVTAGPATATTAAVARTTTSLGARAR